MGYLERVRGLHKDIGNWVAGEDRFFGRERELQHFIELLDGGANVSLIAPRRLGKTSLMREAARRIGLRGEERPTCLHLDLEASREPADFCAELYSVGSRESSLQKRLRRWLERVGLGIAELKFAELSLKVREHFSTSWQVRADDLLADLVERRERVILFLDEVPLFVQHLLGGAHRPDAAGLARAESFLSWLRRAVQRHQGDLSIVVTGSIGLGPMLQRAGLSATINHLTPFELRPWDEETVVACLQALAFQYKLRFEPGVELHVARALGVGIPHHVQLFFDHLQQDARRPGASSVGPRDVDRVYRERLLGSRGHTFLSHYEERLRLAVAPELRALCLDLLTEAAVQRQLTRTAAELLLADHRCEAADDPLGELLGILEHDGYLVAGERGHRFESHLLRDWWAARFGRGYIEAAARRHG